MFIDQEEKASPARRWFFRLLKLAFILAAFFAVFVTVLANMGGSSQTLKEAAEKLIGEGFGHKPALIQTLVRLSFFPLVGLDIEKVQITNPKPEGSVQDTEVVAVFSKIKFFMDFWDVAFRNPRFRTLLIEEGYMNKGIIGEKSMTLERAYVDHDEAKNEAKLVANGLYDKNEWKISIALNVLGGFGKYEYEIGESAPFTVDVGDIHISGSFVKSSDNFLKIESFKIVREGQVVEGDLYASLISSKVIKLKGDLKIRKGEKSNLSLDLLFNFKDSKARVSGDIAGSDFAMDDLFGKVSVRTLFNRLYEILRNDPASKNNAEALGWLLSAADVDVQFDLKDVGLEDSSKASWTMRTRQKDGNMSLEEVKGKVGEMLFDVPAVVVIQKEAQFYALAAGNDLTAPVFKIFGSGAYKSLNMDNSQKIPCAMDALFEDGSDNLLSRVKTKADGKPVQLAIADYTFLTSVFDTVQERECLTFFEQEKQ